jgi:HNH endonuclease
MDKPDRPEGFKTLAGFSSYEFGDLGTIRSIDRKVGGKSYRGTVLKPRPGNKGYLLVNLTDDSGRKGTYTVHKLILRAHGGECPAGMEACHKDDVATHNWWPENLRWAPPDGPDSNRADRMRNRPAAPKPVRPCVRCGQPVDKGGRRCHACVVEIGEVAAQLLESGVALDEVCGRLGYPSESGLHTLARKYGGYGVPRQPVPVPGRPRWTRRVTRSLVTLRERRWVR